MNSVMMNQKALLKTLKHLAPIGSQIENNSKILKNTLLILAKMLIKFLKVVSKKVEKKTLLINFLLL